MGNIFNKKQVWREELHMIKTELAALDLRKAKRLEYAKQIKFVLDLLLVASVFVALILIAFSFIYTSVGLVLFLFALRISFKRSIPGILRYFAERDEAKAAKYSSDKEKLVNEIKNKVSYSEAKSLLAGYDSEIDRANSTVLNLEELAY